SIITLVSFISPFRQDRALAREKAPAGRFIEVYVDAPLTVCEQRDPKGLYVKARAGDIPEFTGISSPYEPPENPEIHLPTAEMSVDRCVDTVLAYLIRDGIVSAARHGEAC
ncbi:MAG: adenylyl-sulfate kinase, partial [Pseudomonadota bacterium]|nr:adenylyl-sulfate kinase [Pseudomonadota bacterium]